MSDEMDREEVYELGEELWAAREDSAACAKLAERLQTENAELRSALGYLVQRFRTLERARPWDRIPPRFPDARDREALLRAESLLQNAPPAPPTDDRRAERLESLVRAKLAELAELALEELKTLVEQRLPGSGPHGVVFMGRNWLCGNMDGAPFDPGWWLAGKTPVGPDYVLGELDKLGVDVARFSFLRRQPYVFPAAARGPRQPPTP